MKIIVFLLFVYCTGTLQAQYRYSVDLNNVKDDKLSISLTTPVVKSKEILFRFPKILPGTYMISDFGRFIQNFKALDNAGRSLPVARIDSNSWKISNANRLHRITYDIEDTWDTEKPNEIYSMAGTNIETNKNFVLNTPGFFGYLEGMRNTSFIISITKPAGFYGSTALVPLETSSTNDVFSVKNIDELYDSPIMYNIPDTTTINVNGSQVLISVYSPTKKLQSSFIAQNLNQLLQATAKYLGGRIPVKKYAFIFYFNGEQKPFKVPGAWEHNYSSFYSLPEIPQQQFISQIVDIAGHEFFHIITPLNVGSKEVKVFNFNEPVLSQHLWLYEGSTEYVSDHVQVKYGLNTVPEFLAKLSGKIQNSKKLYNDSLAFTQLSKHSASKHKDQYGNVYEKGALIAACLDLYLLHLSDGTYDLNKLKQELSILYGKEKYFNDNELFDVITKLTFPEIRQFFSKYVEGNTPLPYEEFLSYAGFNYVPQKSTSELTMGSIVPAGNQQGNIYIHGSSKMNDFGKKMGYKLEDELVSINKVPISAKNFTDVLTNIKNTLAEGDVLTVVVLRKNEKGEKETITLSAPAEKITTVKNHVIEFMPQLSAKQGMVRNAWLTYGERFVSPPAKYTDVNDIPSIVLSMYTVISGPAGKRDWEKFRSLFNPQAKMAAMASLPNGSGYYATMTPEDYIKNNGAFFEKTGFFEESLGQKVYQYGNLATVLSPYQFRLSRDGKIEKRGVNYIQLAKENGRWWITNLSWQEETPENPIPAELLNRKN